MSLFLAFSPLSLLYSLSLWIAVYQTCLFDQLWQDLLIKWHCNQRLVLSWTTTSGLLLACECLPRDCSSSMSFLNGKKIMSTSDRVTGKLSFQSIRDIGLADPPSYRPTSGSIVTSMAGLFHLHNQTINIYSHLIGSVAFLVLPCHFHWSFYRTHSTAQVEDLAVMLIYCLGVAVCFAFSAT